MTPKTTTIALSSNLLCRLSNSTTAPTSITSSCSTPPKRPPIFHSSHRQTRTYADVRDDAQAKKCSSTSSMRWPTHPNPTPYDIFAIDKAAPYTKARFYELVKVYHPDRHPHAHAHVHVSHSHSHSYGHGFSADGLTAATRLERYRLIVLANDILSDPAKRSAYDSYGAGWTLHPHRTIHETYRAADRAWRHRPGNAANNATWEDWEKWYAQRDGAGQQDRGQRPVFMSNTHFVALILATIAVGSAMQASRARETADFFLDRREAMEGEIGAAMARRGRAAAGQGKEERIERFLRERDNWNFGFSPGKYDEPPASTPASSPSREPAQRGKEN